MDDYNYTDNYVTSDLQARQAVAAARRILSALDDWFPEDNSIEDDHFSKAVNELAALEEAMGERAE